MRADVVVNISVQNQGVIHVVRRAIRIERQNFVRVFSGVLKKVLRNHGHFSKLSATLVEQINQHGFFAKRSANVSCNLESGASERVYRHNVAFVEPQPDGGVELTLNSVLARYLRHSLLN